MTRQTRRLLISGTLLLTVIGLSLWGAIYVGTRGFVRKWRVVFAEEMARHHLAVTVDRLTLEPNQGLSGRGMVVYSDPSRELPLAFIDHARLGVHLPSLMVRRPAIRQLVVPDGLIAFADENGDFPLGRPILLGVRGTLTPLAGAWLLDDFHAVFPALELSGRARIDFSREEAGVTMPFDTLRQAAELFAAMEAEGAPGRLTFNLSGDAARGWTGTIDFEAQDVRWAETRFRRIAWSMEMDEGWLHLRDFFLETEEGQLSGRARIAMADGETRFMADGDLGPTLFRLLPGLPDALGLEASSRVMVQVDGGWTLGASRPHQLTGSMNATEFTWNQERIARWQTDFAFREGHWNLRNTLLETSAGQSELTFLQTDAGVRWRCSSTEPVEHWVKRLPEPNGRWLRQMVTESGDAGWQLEVQGESWDPATWLTMPASEIASSAGN